MPLINNHKPLAYTWIFWVALSLPILIATFLGVLIFVSNELGGLCFKPECIEMFFNTFKFPFAIAGLSLPLIAMVAAIHRSNEASLQIRISSAQYEEAINNNRFGNYLKHRESFDKLIDGHCAKSYHGQKCELIVRKLGLYSSLFPGNGFNNIDWNGQHSEKRLELAEMCAKLIKHQAQSAKQDFDPEVVVESICTMQKLFQINYSPFKVFEIKLNDHSLAQEIILPAYCSDAKGLIFAATDCLSILSLINSYIGTNNRDDLSINSHAINFTKNLDGIPSRLITEGKF